MENKEFRWTSELVTEFYNWLDGRSGAPLTVASMNEFKKSKAPNSLFTTQDGESIYEGDKYYYIYINPGISKTWFIYCDGEAESPLIHGDKQFKTERSASEWITWNRPLLSLKEVDSLYTTRCSNALFIEEIKHLVKSKI